uniref:Uncharacterized protein n=1 Tax=Arundo donax TaxID=35708 RepID=A0A0A9FFU6_ARUDO
MEAENLSFCASISGDPSCLQERRRMQHPLGSSSTRTRTGQTWSAKKRKR